MWRDANGDVHTVSPGCDPRDLVPGELLSRLTSATETELHECATRLGDVYDDVLGEAFALDDARGEAEFVGAAPPRVPAGEPSQNSSPADLVMALLASSEPRWRLDHLELLDEVRR